MAALLPSAAAALLLVAVEVARASWVGGALAPVDLPRFTLLVTGTLGAPALLLGLALTAGLLALRRGWRGAVRPPRPSRAVAWTLFVLGLAFFELIIVRWGAAHLAARFTRPVYVGLGAGLVAVGVLLVGAALAGPAVALLERGVGALRPRLPRALDPGARPGATRWAVAAVVLGAALAPTLFPELDSVDLRPGALALLWLGAWLLAGRVRGAPAWLGPLATIGLLGATGWAALAWPDRHDHGVRLVRDTLLAGPAARALDRLSDLDGDGRGALFFGVDCDEGDSTIRGGAYDAPGDGIDQNCTGADLVLAEDPLRPPARTTPTTPPRGWHVVLLTVDALRADVVDRHMPNVGALAAEGVDFRAAYAHGAATYWTVPALLASRMPSRLLMGLDQTPVDRMLLLPEVLRDAGYHTALFGGVTIFFGRGLSQGIAHADFRTSDHTVHGARPGAAHLTDGLLAHARRFVEKRVRPARDRMFLWGHYYDPHAPYFEVPGFAAEADTDRARYEAIVRSVDAEIGRLVAGLKALGLWERTLFVLTSDHGDEFFDHGHRFHGATLYDETVRVPLVLRGPGLIPRRIETPIGHRELAPTLLDLLSIPIPADFGGRSRAEEVRSGRAPAAQPVFFEVFPDENYDGHRVGMRAGPLKLIHDVHTGLFELYDLAADPGERRNLYDRHPRAAALRVALLRYLDHHLYALARGRTGGRPPYGAPKIRVGVVSSDGR